MSDDSKDALIPDEAGLAKQDLWGKYPVVTVGGLVLAISTALFMLYALHHYQLENSNSSILWKLPLCVYLIGVVACFLFQKKLFAYADEAPFLAWMGVVSLPVPVVMFVVAAFLFCNATLDTQKSYVVHYSVIGKGGDLLVQISPGRQSIIIVPASVYESAYRGSKIEATVGPGFFHQPWIKGCTLQE